jgi:hypothetical protein
MRYFNNKLSVILEKLSLSGDKEDMLMTISFNISKMRRAGQDGIFQVGPYTIILTYVEDGEHAKSYPEMSAIVLGIKHDSDIGDFEIEELLAHEMTHLDDVKLRKKELRNKQWGVDNPKVTEKEISSRESGDYGYYHMRPWEIDANLVSVIRRTIRDWKRSGLSKEESFEKLKHYKPEVYRSSDPMLTYWNRPETRKRFLKLAAATFDKIWDNLP